MVADNLIYHLVARITISQGHRGAEDDFLSGQFRNIDHLGARELIFHFTDLHIEQRLAFLGGVKFGIFRQVAVAARLFDIANIFWPLDGFQPLQLFHQKLVSLAGHRHACICHVVNS